MHVYRDLDTDAEYNEWSYLHVNALKTGLWVSHVVEIEEIQAMRIIPGIF